MVRIWLTPEAQVELEQVSKQIIGGRVAQRAQMVLLSSQGHKAPQIAQMQQCSVETVRTWLRRYQQWGVAGLQDLPHGRPRSD